MVSRTERRFANHKELGARVNFCFEKLRQIHKLKVIRLSLNTFLRLLAHNMCRVVACPGRDKLARAQLCKNKYLF